MGLFWGGRNHAGDPTKSLDPDLKQFLDQQQPKPYVTSNAPALNGDALPVSKSPTRSDTTVSPDEKPLPKESLFQDGRYKDIWKTFVPQEAVAAATSTPVERVLSARKDRRELIHRAALENCAFEQELQQNCFSNGDVTNRVRARMTMCNQESKAFNRCYQLQAKFLQALGYLATPDSSSDDEEKVQMHADKLYHRMMDYEAAVEEAKSKKEPIPPLSSLFNPNRPAPTIEQIRLPTKMEKQLKRPLHDYPPHERELAARAILQEAKLTQVYADDFFKYTTTMNEDRKQRQKWLVRTFGDTVGKFFIPDPPSEPGVRPYGDSELEREIWQAEGDTLAKRRTQVDWPDKGDRG